MTEGLITRLGKWMDRKWQEKATWSELDEVRTLFNQRMANVEMSVSLIKMPDFQARLEKVELYIGMTRKVDPTKPAVAKSAFQM